LSTPDGLPPLRDVIRGLDLSARRSLGQNFLLDFNLTRRIARAGGPLEGATIVEIGPGPGGLTRALLLEGASRVVAIEKDRRCLPALAGIAAAYPGRLEIIEADALEIDYAKLNLVRPCRIVANLPYSVATPLLIGWLKTSPWPPWFDRLVLMFQRSRAITLAPPTTRSPTFTNTSASRGKYTSVRDPKRIIPKRSPRRSSSPTLDQLTIRRAIAPVNWRTTIVARELWNAQVIDSFFSEHSGRRASRKSPLRCSRYTTRPSTGMRLVWTLNTERKIPTRRIFVFTTSGSSTSMISVMVPSAAARTAWLSLGAVRSGSRKNASV